MKLSSRIKLVDKDRDWLNDMAEKYHYMNQRVHPISCPFGWAISFDDNLFRPDGKPAGFIIFSSIHFTKLKGEFGYEGLPTRWQVLSLSRLWLHDDLPKNSESVVIGKCLRQKGHENLSPIQRKWLQVHPPRYPDEPYHIRKVISYADLSATNDDGVPHEGYIYRATNFRFTGKTFSPVQNGSRGKGMGNYLHRYIYDLEKPNICWSEIQK